MIPDTASGHAPVTNAHAAPSGPPASAIIRCLRIAEEPFWVDVDGAGAAGLDLQAKVRGWPAGTRCTALAVFEFAEAVPPSELKEAGLSASKTAGPFVYLDDHLADGAFTLRLRMPAGRIRRFGFRLWSHKKDIFLDELHIAVHGAAPVVGTVAQQVELFREGDESADAIALDTLAVDLMDGQDGCGPRCAERVAKWFESMDEYAKKSSLDLGRTDCYHELGAGRYAAVEAYHGRPAMLHIPASTDLFLEQIGDKSRNMVRKARREGYHYVAVDPNLHIDDIVAIRVSAPVRQGKPIPASFYARPSKIIAASPCKYHGDAFYGIFKGDRLVAYTTLYLYGQLAQVNHLLGHADHLKDGVMNLLMVEVVDDIIRNRPWIRAINYLYPGSATATSGTALFKRSMGFDPRRLLVTRGDTGFADLLDARRARILAARTAPPPAPAAAKSVPRLDSAELGETVSVVATPSRKAALATLLEAGPGGDAPYRRVKWPNEQGDALAELRDASVIVVEGVSAANVTGFLSSGLKQFKGALAKGAFLLFDFPRDVDTDAMQQTREYYMRRFKSPVPAPEAIRDGFKGSDFVLRGIADYAGFFTRRGQSVLLLKKIR